MTVGAGPLLDAVPIPMLVVGPDERLAEANPAALRLLDSPTMGRHHATAMRQPALLAAIEAALLRGQGATLPQVEFGGAHVSVFRVTVTAVDLGAGRSAVCAFEDVTEQEQIGQFRRDFVANVSHELRTPLTALIGFIETLKGAARDDAAARMRFLSIMEREAGRMNRLVRDLLSLSRVEAQERMRPTERVDVVSSVALAVAAMRSLADEAGVAVEVSGAGGPLFVPADPDQLTQVWQNLIENAVKYGASGGRVTVRIAAQDPDPVLRGPGVRVEVADQGEGIDPIHLPRLTERFYRADTHRAREMGGTGLGLAIVKHIVNRHRGRLRIDSAPGQGSRFAVILPST